ncbi:sulfatase, partial [Candidatus Sumerlaeota bacterium]|nr:sulfatase [Candidatus Sumerlaeota bacterium]
MGTRQTTDRREFLRLAAVGSMAAAMSARPRLGQAAGASKERPNILYCVGDDWGWPACGAYGDKVVKTPAFDRVAAEGVLFTNAFCASPSCTPSRSAMLTGQAIHRLEESGNLWSTLQRRFKIYPDLLEEAGYFVGLQGKGWGPGDVKVSGWDRNPAGPSFKSFDEFIGQIPKGKPFCFFWGTADPHRPYQKGTGVESGMKIEDVAVPPFWPDTPEVRSDICDYYFEIQRADGEIGRMIATLEKMGQLDNTIVVITGDNGMPFPRCKANLYNYGAHQPLAVRWSARAKGGRVVNDFISLTDIAPTFLEAAGLKPLLEMTGRSFLDLVTGENPVHRDKVFVERERHANVRQGNKSYPCRAIRTTQFLYLRNLRPDLWPAGDPQLWHSVGTFGDCDGGPTKDYILDRRDQPEMKKFF